jgi:2-hydroxy-6-oxonona-2,4-dienedioate hydrolase
MSAISGAASLISLGAVLGAHRRTDAANLAVRQEDAGRASTATHSRKLRSVTVRVNGIPMHTLVSAEPPPVSAPAVVLVHGLALSGQYMVPTAELLADHYPVYVPDLPGFGDSGKPDRALDVPALADALAAWMPAAGLERAMLLGNSFACQIIADFAARHPDRVERAVLQGPTTPPRDRGWLRQYIRWRQNSPYNPPEMGAIARNDYLKCGIVRALLTFEYSLRDRVEEKLPKIRAPMLVVRGAIDPICHQDWAEAVTRLLPQGRLIVIPDVAHTLVFTAPHELVAAARPFFDAASPAGWNTGQWPLPTPSRSSSESRPANG